MLRRPRARTPWRSAGGTDLYPNMKRRQFTPKVLVGLRADRGRRRHPRQRRADAGRADHPRRRRRGPRPSSTAGRWSRARRGSWPRRCCATPGTIGGNLCVDTRCNYYNQTEFWRASIGYCMKRDGDICLVAPGSSICWALSSSDTAPVMIALGADGDAGGGGGRAADRGRRPLRHRRHQLPVQARGRDPDRDPRPRRRRAGARPTASCGAAARSISPWWGWRRRCASARAATVEEARIVLGAVHTTPVVARDANEFLRGKAPRRPRPSRWRPGIAYKPAKPLDNADLVYSWRKRMVRIEVARALRELARPAHRGPATSALRAEQRRDLVGPGPRLRPRIEASRHDRVERRGQRHRSARPRGRARHQVVEHRAQGKDVAGGVDAPFRGASRGSSAPARGAGGPRPRSASLSVPRAQTSRSRAGSSRGRGRARAARPAAARASDPDRLRLARVNFWPRLQRRRQRRPLRRIRSRPPAGRRRR